MSDAELRTVLAVLTVVAIVYATTAAALWFAARWSPSGRALARTLAQNWVPVAAYPVTSLFANLAVAAGDADAARRWWLVGVLSGAAGLAMLPTLLRRFSGDESARYVPRYFALTGAAGVLAWVVLAGDGSDRAALAADAGRFRAFAVLLASVICIRVGLLARRDPDANSPLRFVAVAFAALALRPLVTLPVLLLPISGFVLQLLALAVSLLVTGVAPVAFLAALAAAERRAIRARYAHLRSVELRLARAQREVRLSQLADGLARDFAHVIEGVSEVTEEFTRRAPADATVMRSTQLLRDASKHAGVIVSQLRDCSSDADGPRVRFDLRELVRRNLHSLNVLAPAHVVALGQTEVAPVIGAPEQIERALYSLVANARDASAEGRPIVVSLERFEFAPGALPSAAPVREPGAYVRLSVTDEGSGIPEDRLELVMQPYFTTKETAGTGLGLPAARTIARSHGGELTIDSCVGVGTSVHLWFPLEARPAGSRA